MCCGCAACEQRCPTSCIVMREDEEGFLYPQTDTSKCIDCGLCEKYVRYSIRAKSGSRSMYMRQKHKDSDSAAKFFGRYLHPYSGTDHSEERRGFRCPFRRELGCRTRLYRNARRTRGHAGQQVCAKPYRPHLPAGERISGIRPSGALFGHSLSNKRFKAFLAKEYENLLTVDLVCHGVPSPEIWRQYLHEIIATGGGRHPNSELRSTSQITSINFRDKTTGWQSYSLRFSFRRETGSGLPETADVSRIHYKDPFFYCFLSHVTERYSCYACPAKELKSGSDITLGDFGDFAAPRTFRMTTTV